MIRILLALCALGAGWAAAHPPEATTVTGLGDSITAQAGPETQRSDKGWVNWVGLLTDQRLTWQNQSAAGGYNSEQILNELLPELLSRSCLPDYVVVLAGTNDLSSGFTLDQTTANLSSIYAKLVDAGVQPVAATIPPNANPAYHPAIEARNDWIRWHAFSIGLPLVDFHGALEESGTGVYRAGLSDDGVHPTPAGAKVMADTVINVLLPEAGHWMPPLVTAEAPESLVPNALMLADENGDGVPYGWGAIGDRSTSTPLLTPAAVGNWFEVRRTGVEGQAVYRTSAIKVELGGAYALSFRVDAEVENGAFTVDVIQEGDWRTRLAGPLYSWSSSVDDALWYGEFTVPAGVESIQLQVNFQVGSGVVRIAQVTLVEVDR